MCRLSDELHVHGYIVNIVNLSKLIVIFPIYCCISSMSLGGGKSTALNDAVTEAIGKVNSIIITTT